MQLALAVPCMLREARCVGPDSVIRDTRRVGFSACAAEMAPFREGAAFPCQCGLETSRTCTVPCLSTEKRRQLGITLTTSLHRRACSRLSAAAVAVTTTGDVEIETVLTFSFGFCKRSEIWKAAANIILVMGNPPTG